MSSPFFDDCQSYESGIKHGVTQWLGMGVVHKETGFSKPGDSKQLVMCVSRLAHEINYGYSGADDDADDAVLVCGVAHDLLLFL